MEKKILVAALAAQAQLLASSFPSHHPITLDRQSEDDKLLFGLSKDKTRTKGKSQYSGNTHQAKIKRIRKIARKSRQYNRRQAKGK